MPHLGVRGYLYYLLLEKMEMRLLFLFENRIPLNYRTEIDSRFAVWAFFIEPSF